MRLACTSEAASCLQSGKQCTRLDWRAGHQQLHAAEEGVGVAQALAQQLLHGLEGRLQLAADLQQVLQALQAQLPGAAWVLRQLRQLGDGLWKPAIWLAVVKMARISPRQAAREMNSSTGGQR